MQTLRFPSPQSHGRFLEALVLAELSCQLIAYILLLRVFLWRWRREQSPGLDQQQLGRNNEEVGEEVDPDILENADILQVLIGHSDERDLGDIQFTLLDEPEQEIQRALEDVQSDLKRRRGCVELPIRPSLWMAGPFPFRRVAEPSAAVPCWTAADLFWHHIRSDLHLSQERIILQPWSCVQGFAGHREDGIID